MTPVFPIDVLPLPPEDLVGRDAITEDLIHRLLGGQSVLIPGPRRTGKSAVASEVQRRLSERRLALTATVDLFECGDVRELARKLTTAVLATVDPRWRRLQVRSDRALAEGLRNAEVSLGVLGVDLLRWVYRVEKLETAELLDRALTLPEELAQRLRQPLVIVLDEFQELRALDPSFGTLKRMRAHWQRQQHTALLFLGSQGSLIRDLFTAAKMPLYRFADLVALPPIASEAWETYMHAKFQEAGWAIEPHAARELIARTGGHPFDSMKVLQAVVRRGERGGTSVVDRDLALLGYMDAARDLARYFEAEVKALDVPLARAMLVRLASGQGVYVPGVGPSQNRRTADALVAQGVLERPAPRHYRFVEPMLAEFLAGEAPL
ncbi:MAG: AAA family ATPase [Clostridia bacterium]